MAMAQMPAAMTTKEFDAIFDGALPDKDFQAQVAERITLHYVPEKQDRPGVYEVWFSGQQYFAAGTIEVGILRTAPQKGKQGLFQGPLMLVSFPKELHEQGGIVKMILPMDSNAVKDLYGIQLRLVSEQKKNDRPWGEGAVASGQEGNFLRSDHQVIPPPRLQLRLESFFMCRRQNGQMYNAPPTRRGSQS
jgi:hypothetical protein